MSARKKAKFTSFAFKLLLGGLLLAAAGLVYLIYTPRIYRATTRLKLVKSAWNNTNDPGHSFGPEMLPAECQLIRSNGILDQAITNLGLNEAWGIRYRGGAPLNTEESRERLRLMLDAHPLPKAIMVEIQVTESDRREAARIANEITKVYRDFRERGREQASRAGTISLLAKREEQSKKVRAAQAVVDKLAYESRMDRATNHIYDADSFQKLQADRITLEDNYIKQKNLLAKLKTMDKEELKDVLSSMETNTVLNSAEQQLIQAKSDLLAVQTAHGAESKEAKGAALAVDNLDQRISQMLGSIVSARQVEIDSMKASLDEMNVKLKHATTDANHFTMQDSKYAKALEDLRRLTRERDALEQDIIDNGAISAVMPSAITAEIVELADPPMKPISPDARLGFGVVIAGGGCAVAGLFLLALLNMKPRPMEKKA